MGEKDDYDSENSWISDGLPSSSRRRRRRVGRWEVGEWRENINTHIPAHTHRHTYIHTCIYICTNVHWLNNQQESRDHLSVD